jgi:hypothetical protein
MSEPLSAIEFVSLPTNSKDSFSPCPSGHVTPHSHATADVLVVSGCSLRAPLDLEGGGLKESRVIVIIAVLTGVNFLSSLSNGFITIGLPRIASDLSLPEHLMIWPTAVN